MPCKLVEANVIIGRLNAAALPLCNNFRPRELDRLKQQGSFWSLGRDLVAECGNKCVKFLGCLPRLDKRAPNIFLGKPPHSPEFRAQAPLLGTTSGGKNRAHQG